MPETTPTVPVKVNPLKRPTIKRIKDPIPKSKHKLKRVPNPKKDK